MSSPSEWFRSLPVISRTFGTLCMVTTIGFQLGVIKLSWIYLDFALVGRKFQIWRLLTNFLFLGPFSTHFGMRLLMIARYGVQLEQGPFAKRTADFLWMLISTAMAALLLSLAIPSLRENFFGSTLCFMLVYVWSREFPTSGVNIMGLVQFQGFYIPWALLAVNTVLGAPFLPDLLGIIIGHVYYFLTVLHPRDGGRQLLRTPKWLGNMLAKYGVGERPQFIPVPQAPASTQGVFTGRSYRLNRD